MVQGWCKDLRYAHRMILSPGKWKAALRSHPDDLPYAELRTASAAGTDSSAVKGSAAGLVLSPQDAEDTEEKGVSKAKP